MRWRPSARASEERGRTGETPRPCGGPEAGRAVPLVWRERRLRADGVRAVASDGDAASDGERWRCARLPGGVATPSLESRG